MCSILGRIVGTILLFLYLCAASIEIYMRLMHNCPHFSFDGYAKSTIWEAIAVYTGLGSAFYLQQRHSFEWNASNMFAIFQFAEGIRVFFSLICARVE